ncbi:MAG: efflux RND transporter periplasmic adaptor subunit [Verrucomicrobia bacterium]|nr:efflux RND transporter periplasmic adaptor subunit [Verrucomicrobiota bacterium]
MNSVITKVFHFLRRQPRWRLTVAVLALAVAGYWIFGGSPKAMNEITFEVKRGPMDIIVLEGGSIEALQSQEIRSEVKGSSTKILKIVEEGYQVTEEDVQSGKVLVELDSADIQSRMTQQEIQFQSSIASLTEARQSYEIQRNQNTSTIKAAEQKAQFAKMDFEKFMGDQAFNEIVVTLKLDKLEAAASKIVSGEDVERIMLTAMETNELWMAEEYLNREETDKTALRPAVISTPNRPTPARRILDFTRYANAEMLGDGSAMQQLRKLTDEKQTAEQQRSLSRTKLAGTRLLFERGFVTQTELDTEEITAKNNELKVATTVTAYNLFIKYEFQKQAQELVSKYEEALRGLEREKKEGISKLAQSRARLKGAEGRYNIEANQRRDWLAQLEKCQLRAQKPGLVVYGGGSSDGYYSNNEQIREGAAVRERQPIITIPDMTRMGVRVKVHESYIQKIHRGLPAKIQVDAFPNRKLMGEVTKVALLPDSQNRWTNPDLKVYQTMVTIVGTHDWLKPGMSAKVEILVKQLDDVLYVPLQAVSELAGKHFCYVAGIRVEMREVEIGDFNDEFIEIKKGLNEGENVLLRAPSQSSAQGKSKKKNERPAESDPLPAPVQEDTPDSAGKSTKPAA